MKFKDINDFGGACGIYLVTNLINGHKYVGQTTRMFKDRWKEHYYSATCNQGKQQKTPLHQAIIKYGIDNFDFSVLENCTQALLDQTEQKWINQLGSAINGNYNLTDGGQNNNLREQEPDYISKIRQDLKTTLLSGSSIAKKYNILEGVVSNINTGIRYHDEREQYPLRTIRTQTLNIINIIESNPNVSLTALANQYHSSLSVFKAVNNGYGQHHLDGYSYPIRNSKKVNSSLINDIKNSSLSFQEIANKYNVCYDTVCKTNTGRRNFIQGEKYPLRVTR